MRPWWLGGRACGRAAPSIAVDVLRTRPSAWRDGIAAAEALAADGGRTRLAAAQATDMTDWLPHDLLLKLDRCLMAHAMEGRTPFLDPGVARGGLPAAGRAEAAARHGQVDPAQVAGEAPAGGAPLRAEARLHRAGGRLDQAAGRRGWARWWRRSPAWRRSRIPSKVEALFGDIRRWRHGFACWTLLFYALWHRRHIQGLPPVGDVFETLAAG